MYFLADCNVITSGRNSHTLNRLDIIRKFNKLHLILATINKFLDNSLTGSVDKLQFLLLLDETDRIFKIEVTI